MKPKKGTPKKTIGAGGADGPEALRDAIDAIHKSHGTGSIMYLGEERKPIVDGISTGSIGLDLAIGGRGLPRGRIVEIYGPESSGKTTLTLHVVASAQRAGGVAAFIDAEHALDPSYAQKLGVDIDSLLISQPDNGEQALDIAETLTRSGAVDVIVIDSVAALVPRAEIEGEMGDNFVGLHARLMSQALRKLTGIVSRTGCTLVFINQIREKIGVMFGSPETTTGGRALKFYSSVRLDIRRIGQIKDGDQVTGNRTKCTVVKNKVAPPFRRTEFDIIFNEGINRLGELLDMGVENNVLKRSGTWVSYGDVRLGQGRERSREFLKENPEIAQGVYRDLMRALGIPAPGATDSTEESSEAPVAAGPKGSAGKPAAAKPAATKPKAITAAAEKTSVKNGNAATNRISAKK